MRVILAIARKDFDARARVDDGDDILDGIAAGLNMLADEAARQHRLEEEYRARLLRSERLAAIGTLAAGVAHEINNPAAFLLGNFVALDDLARALRVEPNEERRQRLADEVAEIASVGHSGVERIARIVRGLRNFARIEHEAVAPVRLDEVAEQACTLASRELVHRARLIRRLESVPEVLGDRTKLTQVVTNLLVNAAQALDTGAASRNLVELSVAAEGEDVVLRVRDNGPGIAEHDRARVFDPFFTTKAPGEGTGLGLSISADIARQHGGELRFTTGAGGTTFELVLPRETGLVAATSTVRTTPRLSVAPPPVPRRPRVLLIDDEEQILRAYRRMLARTHDVETALGGEAALEVLEKDRAWSAIVCDLLMPGIDGAGVWEWVETNAPALTSRLIFCSGGAFTSRGAAFAEEHRDRLLDKPLSRPQLEAALARLSGERT